MSQRERDLLKVLAPVLAGKRTQREAAHLFGLIFLQLLRAREKTLEMGLLKALGVTRGRLRRLCLAEASAVWAVGMARGALGSVLLLGLVNHHDPPLPSGQHFGRLGRQETAEELAEAGVLDAGHRLRGAEPAARAAVSLGPFVGRLGHAHQEDGDVAEPPGLFVEVAPHWLALQAPQQASLFPGLAEGRFGRGVAGLDVSLGDHPPLAAAGLDQAEPS
jgi:hypothetical protein